eukprot:CFRG3118T1
MNNIRSLRSGQRDALKNLLNLNQPIKKGVEPDWKVFVYDRYGQDIISPNLKVGELRDLGVTLHLLLHSNREQIVDSPAVYLCMPTSENIERICQDLRANVYEEYYLNFISAIPRSMLELIAAAALEANAVTHVAKVFDQYLNFITLEDDLFCLNLRNNEAVSYRTLNDPNAKDTDIERAIDVIVDSLFSSLVTAGTVPIIRSQRNNAAEMVAQRLDSKLRDYLKNTRNNLFAEAAGNNISFQRPVLIIMDRNLDIPSILHHTWTYQPLVSDLLGLRSNRVVVEGKAEGGNNKKPKSYDMDAENDFFWLKHRRSPFPTVAGEVEAELNKYKSETAEITALSEAIGVDPNNLDMENLDLSSNAAKLNSAVSNLPQLTEKKRHIDLHTTLAWALLDQIKERALDNFFEIEDRCMRRVALDQPIVSYLKLGAKGTPNDKLRLYLIYFLTTENISSAEEKECEAALSVQGADLSCLQYLRQMKQISQMAEFSGGTDEKQSSSAFSYLSKRVLEQGSELLKQGVKNFIPPSSKLPTTRIVDAIMEQKQTKETEDYRYFDPKILRPNDIARARTMFTEAIVFMVGGGNYVEFHNLKDYQDKAQMTKHITYGATTLFSPEEFLTELTELGGGGSSASSLQ